MKLVALLLALVLSNPAPEDKGKASESAEKESVRFYGTVIEEMTGDPLVGAVVYVKEFDKEIYTDFDGNFVIDNLTPGQYDIEISCVSFSKKELDDIHINSTHNFVLISLQ